MAAVETQSPVDVLHKSLGNALLTSASPADDLTAATAVFNGFIPKRKPEEIVVATGVADVMAAVKYANAKGLKVSLFLLAGSCLSLRSHPVNFGRKMVETELHYGVIDGEGSCFLELRFRSQLFRRVLFHVRSTFPFRAVFFERRNVEGFIFQECART